MSTMTTAKAIPNAINQGLGPVGGGVCLLARPSVAEASPGGVSPGGTPVPGSSPGVP